MVRNILNHSQKLLSKQQSGILSAAALITLSSLLSAVLGLLRNRLLVERFFSSPELKAQLDAYWVAFRLPELAFQLLVIGSISAAFIPVYSRYKEKSGQDATIVVNSILNMVLLVFFVISVVIFMFAREFNQLITGTNFSPEQVELAAGLSKVMLIAQLFFGVSNFMTGIIQSNQRFLVPALAPLAYNLGIIGGIVGLTPVMGIYGPAVGVVIGAMMHLVIQIPLARQLGFGYRPLIRLAHPGVRDMVKLMPPRALAISVNQLEVFTSVYFATALPAGSLTIVNLAQQLMTAPNRIFSVPLGQASLPFLSRQVAGNKMNDFKQTFAETMRHIMFLAMPAAALLLVLRVPLVRIAYGSSEFPWSATVLTGRMVAILSLGLFAQGGIHLLVRAFYALHNTVTPFVISLVSLAVNIGLSYMTVMVYHKGVLGLAVAVTVSTLVQFILLYLWISRSIRELMTEEILKPAIKIVAASIMMAVFLWVPMRVLDQYVFDTTRTVPLIMLTIVASAVGGSVYLWLAYGLKIEEYAAYVKLAKRLGRVHTLLMPTEEIIDTPTQTQEVKPL